MLRKQISYDHTITEFGCIQVRQITRIMEDDKELSKSYHRHVVNPGDNTEEQDERTKLIAKTIHTPEVIAAYQEKFIRPQEGRDG